MAISKTVITIYRYTCDYCGSLLAETDHDPQEVIAKCSCNILPVEETEAMWRDTANVWHFKFPVTTIVPIVGQEPAANVPVPFSDKRWKNWKIGPKE